jgi:hypothetical protein
LQQEAKQELEAQLKHLAEVEEKGKKVEEELQKHMVRYKHLAEVEEKGKTVEVRELRKHMVGY